MVTTPGLLSPTPSVIRITIGVASPLVLGLVSVMNSTPVFPQMARDAIWVKYLSKMILKEKHPRVGVLGVMCPLPLKTVRGGMDPLATHYSTWLCWVITSGKESNCNEIGLRVGGMEIPGGVDA